MVLVEMNGIVDFLDFLVLRSGRGCFVAFSECRGMFSRSFRSLPIYASVPERKTSDLERFGKKSAQFCRYSFNNTSFSPANPPFPIRRRTLPRHSARQSRPRPSRRSKRPTPIRRGHNPGTGPRHAHPPSLRHLQHHLLQPARRILFPQYQGTKSRIPTTSAES